MVGNKALISSNQVLTLASNERIPLRASMRMVFEIRDLKFATPATVSRAGILYVSTAEGQQWHSLIASWVTGSGYSETVKAQLSGLFDSYIPKAVQVLTTQMKTTVECEPTTAVSVMLQVRAGIHTAYTRTYRSTVNDHASPGFELRQEPTPRASIVEVRLQDACPSVAYLPSAT